MSSAMEYPTSLSFSATGKDEWTLARGLSARLNVRTDEDVADELLRIDPNTVICSSAPDAGAGGSEERVPVYQVGDHGPVAVPTGRIFVRFDKQPDARQNRQIEQSGFVIEKTSAPTNSVWVRHQSGSCRDALLNFQRLGDVDGVARVEPELLMRRESKMVSGRRKLDG